MLTSSSIDPGRQFCASAPAAIKLNGIAKETSLDMSCGSPPRRNIGAFRTVRDRRNALLVTVSTDPGGADMHVGEPVLQPVSVRARISRSRPARRQDAGPTPNQTVTVTRTDKLLSGPRGQARNPARNVGAEVSILRVE